MENKISKKLIIISIIIGLVLLIGSSYAWYIITIRAKNPNIIKSGKLSLIVDDKAAQQITIDKAVPVTDEEGQEYIPYTFTLENDGTINSGYTIYLDDAELTDKERMDDKYIKYSLTKNNETPKIALLSSTGTSPNRILDTGTIIPKEKIFYELRIWIDFDATNEAMDKAFNLKLRVEATQAQNKKLCRRATENTLHTETCSYTSGIEHCYADGYYEGGTQNTTTITYGKVSDIGTLATGDAFDCDVNGDGTYDAAKERFYYVTDMDANTAVLVYYNNVSEGIASNSTAYAYDSSKSNNNGPVTAKLQLPKTTQWPNVSLTSTTRAITNEQDGTTTTAGDLPATFSYEGYAARLLTYQEVYNGCYDEIRAITSVGGLSTKCKFLLENTIYSNSSYKDGFWFETPSASNSYNATNVSGNSRRVSSSNVHNESVNGVRPAIEVPKTNILY